MQLARQHDGYAMAALLVAMSIMAVMMTVAMPTWQQMARREKEAELVFRGEQYARALTLFQTKNGPGTTPANFDVLVEQRFLRKKFKDPITNSDFVPISLAAGQPGGAQGTGAAGRGTTPQTGTTQSTAQRGNAGATGAATPGATAAVGAVAGIMGVTSKSTEQSIRLYKGRSHYNEWQFTPVQRTATAGQGGAAGGAAGQRGAGGVGGQRGAGGQGGRGGNPPNPQNPFGGGGGAGAPGGGRANPPPPSNPNGAGPFPPARGNR